MNEDRRWLIELDDISRRFGSVMANDRISCQIGTGEIVGLVGENGAGKSTLLAIIGGYDTPNSGVLCLDGRRTRFGSPRDAIAVGIALVHQHLSLVPTFTVLDQLRLAGGGVGDVPTGLDPAARIDTLAMGVRQRVEIARALTLKPRILLLDEPTSILAPGEIDDLFAHLVALRNDGATIVVVSHKLHEIVRLVDRALVLRNGRLVAELSRDKGTWPMDIEDRLVRAMFGEVSARTSLTAPPSDAGDSPIVVLAGFSVDGPRGDAVYDVDLAIRRGQMTGIVGIDGNGQRALAEGIAGYRPHDGTMTFVVSDDGGVSVEATVAYLSGDRIGEASIGSMTLGDNLRLKRRGWRRLDSRASTAMLDQAAVQPADPAVRFDTLSGGNMQRALIARELAERPDIVIAEHPVHGLDRRSAEQVWSDLRSFAQDGHAVVVLTGDVDDALAECDEIAVLTKGRLSPLTPVAATGRETVGRLMLAG